MHDAIQYYRLARHVTDRLAKGPKVITLPAKPNWAQLDMAERIIQKSGNPAKVTFPEGMDRQGAIVESIAQTVDSIRGSLSSAPASKKPIFVATAYKRNSSEERRVGKECVSTCRSLWSPYLYYKTFFIFLFFFF